MEAVFSKAVSLRLDVDVFVQRFAVGALPGMGRKQVLFMRQPVGKAAHLMALRMVRNLIVNARLLGVARFVSIGQRGQMRFEQVLHLALPLQVAGSLLIALAGDLFRLLRGLRSAGGYMVGADGSHGPVPAASPTVNIDQAKNPA